MSTSSSSSSRDSEDEQYEREVNNVKAGIMWLEDGRNGGRPLKKTHRKSMKGW
jgi:hypothetical protein